MAVAEQGAPTGFNPRARNTAASLSLIGAVAGAATIVLLFVAPAMLAQWGVEQRIDTVSISLLAASVVFMLLGGVIVVPRLGLGGAIVLIGVLFWVAGCISYKSFGWVLAAPLVVAFLGALTGMISNDRQVAEGDSRLIYRQNGITRLTHWVWAIAMFFLLLSGLQIFNARPNLYIGQQSGFGFENSILDIYATNGPNGPAGQTKLFGQIFDTSGVLGMSGSAEQPSYTAFPGWATIPGRPATRS